MIPSSRGRDNRPPHLLRLDARDELERFKRDVNLTELAASYGYRLIGREQSAAGKWRGSTAASILMRHPTTDDKIVIRRDRDGHWTYFSVRGESDSGSVIDFVQRRHGPGLGAVRKELREWMREDRPRLPLQLYRSNVRTQTHDEQAVRTSFEKARVGRSSYLAERSIDPDVERCPRFGSRYRIDARGNVLFPHCDPSSGRVVGYEAKNRGYTAFAAGGRKTFWISETRPDDNRLVIVETAIDALSYHQVFPYARTRYLSTGGAVGNGQLALIVAAIAAMPTGADIVSATDADAGGKRLHDQIEAAAGRPLRRHASPVPKDWNDYLKSLDHARKPKRENRLER